MTPLLEAFSFSSVVQHHRLETVRYLLVESRDAARFLPELTSTTSNFCGPTDNAAALTFCNYPILNSRSINNKSPIVSCATQTMNYRRFYLPLRERNWANVRKPDYIRAMQRQVKRNFRFRMMSRFHIARLVNPLHKKMNFITPDQIKSSTIVHRSRRCYAMLRRR